MSIPVKQKIPVNNTHNNAEHKNTADYIRARKSQELVIGICGAIGSGTRELCKIIGEQLKNYGYHIENIKISDLIHDMNNGSSTDSPYERYTKYQNAGNANRKDYGASFLAEMAIQEIHVRREKYNPSNIVSNAPEPTKKVAYILNQLKHPDEIALLQTVYQHNFYVIGISCKETDRRSYLKDIGIEELKVHELIDRDRKEDSPHGQQVEKSFYKADYFIHNNRNSTSLKDSVQRFIELLHGVNIQTPTRDERGIYAAFSASLQSACLSRQVGAAIMDEDGNILSTGCNDVPAYMGGLYGAEHGKNDHRCAFKGGCCYNDLHKSLLEKEFQEILELDSVNNAQQIAQQLLKSTKAKDLIEYSRSIHAEMTAILQLARTTSSSTNRTTLYCTTYPCHSCARHIVAAGILRVVYIEPYEKSLALRLHDDSISDKEEGDKVSFEPFKGVAPRRYSKFFQAVNDRKQNGKAVSTPLINSEHVDPQYLDAYTEYEEKVIDVLHKKIPRV